MNDMPLISVIVPVYNVEKYLKRCVDSIINQTYNNLEIILVDDGSPDNCPQLCDEYSVGDNRIKVIHKENGGLSDARNAGIEAATGEYISFIDSDDYIASAMLEKMLYRIQKDKSDMAICGLLYVNGDKEAERYKRVHENMCVLKNSIWTQKEFWNNYFDKSSIVCTVMWNKLYRKSLFDGLKFRKGKQNEDDFMLHHIVDRCNVISCLGEKMYFYWQRADGIMGTTFSIKKLDVIRAYLERTEYFLAMEEQNFAERMMSRTISPFVRFKNEIDFKNDKDKARYTELKKECKKCILKVAKKSSVRFRAIAFVYLLGDPIYLWACRAYRIYSNLKTNVMIIHPIKKWKEKNPEGIFLVLTPQHGNLGDHAIALAETAMLKRLEIPYYEITGNMLNKIENVGKLSVLNGKAIVVNGGGNLGTLWPNVEELFRALIRECPNSKIVACPNTIYYGTDDDGKRSFSESIEIYNIHDYLHLFAREQTSYEIMRAVYRRVKLVPDMVLSLSQLSHSTRNGCLLVLRKDREKTIADTVVMEIIKICSSLFDVVNKTDMVVPYGVMPKNRETELARKWEEFQKAELVITDRLHGMIFAAITETPCIVLDSMSPKVRGCYEWIKELNYIKFADSAKDIPILYEQIKNKTPRYDNLKYLKLMRPLEEELLMLKNGSA